MSTFTIHGNLDVYTHSKLNTNLQKKCLKYNLPKLMNYTPKRVTYKINTHSLQGFINYGKHDMIHKYSNIMHYSTLLYMSAKSITSITITMEANHTRNTHILTTNLAACVSVQNVTNFCPPLSFRLQTSRKCCSHSKIPIRCLWTAFCVPLSFIFYEKQ